MNQQLDKIFATAAIDTLERLAFVFAFPAGEKADWRDEAAMVATVFFKGAFAGSLGIKVSQNVLSEIAANMLGEDECGETGSPVCEDALRETANVICGNLLSEIAGKEKVFYLDAPQVTADGEPAHEDAAGLVSKVNLTLDNGNCALWLLVDGPIPADLVARGFGSE